MKELQIFNNADFGEIRVLEMDSEPWFVGKDIADILGYSNSRKAIGDHVDEEDKGVTKCYTPGGKQDLLIINESGLYSLILSSKLESARKFKRWITSEILPSIRKTGTYKVPSGNELISLALIEAHKVLEQKDRQIEEMKPKALFADAVATSKTSILIGELAKILKQNGIDVGQKRLFEWLRNRDYLIKSGSSKNIPTQRAMDMKLFEIKEGSYVDNSGNNITTKTTKVTGKGQQYFINIFLNTI